MSQLTNKKVKKPTHEVFDKRLRRRVFAGDESMCNGWAQRESNMQNLKYTFIVREYQEGKTHTPGPWSVETGGISGMIPGEVVKLNDERGCKRIPLCMVAGLGPEACANAELIAAAPDLLEAARVARAVLETLTSDSKYDNIKNMLWSSIAKAEGRTP